MPRKAARWTMGHIYTIIVKAEDNLLLKGLVLGPLLVGIPQRLEGAFFPQNPINNRDQSASFKERDEAAGLGVCGIHALSDIGPEILTINGI